MGGFAVRGTFACLVALATCWGAALATAAEPAASEPTSPTQFRGRSLTEALMTLQAQGVPLVFSSRLVLPAMRVQREPTGASAREILASLLEPHGLCAVEAPGGRLVVVLAPRPPASRTARAAPAEPGGNDLRFEEMIVVNTERAAPNDAVSAQSLEAQDLASRASLGDDPLRGVGALPGTIVSEGSSRVLLRGGRDDDVLILLDGLELLAPYHLQEFDSALSIVAPTALERVDLIASGYSAQYGDRMGGVLDLVTTRGAPGKWSLGLGLTHLDASGSSRYAEGRGAWYASARGGSYVLALEFGGRDANPHFWDSFGKIDFELRPGHTVRMSALFAQDQLSITPTRPEQETYAGSWESGYVWLTDHALLAPTLEVETIVSAGEIERKRSARLASVGANYSVRDLRSLQVASLKQVWRYGLSPSVSLEGGGEVREMGASIDYLNDRRLSGPLTSLRSVAPTGTTGFAGHFDYSQTAAFTTARLRLDTLTGDLGLRYEIDTSSDEEHLSPRLNLGWALGERTVAGASWGWYFQSQRPNELQVEDEEFALQRAERSEHRTLALVHTRPSGTALRLEAFQRLTTRGRSRFVNLFDSLAFFPELATDRVQIVSDRGRAVGLELGVSGRKGPAQWRLAYTLAKAEDFIGNRWVPRSFDQRHAASAGFTYQGAKGWSLDAAWTIHSGWPTTAVLVPRADSPNTPAEPVPVLGPLNGERLPTYHRLDLRLAKSWELALGTLTAHIDLQNAYNQRNVRGRTAFRFLPDAAQGYPLVSDETYWGKALPSFGVRWSF